MEGYVVTNKTAIVAATLVIPRSVLRYLQRLALAVEDENPYRYANRVWSCITLMKPKVKVHSDA
jgi:hypothetical protein